MVNSMLGELRARYMVKLLSNIATIDNGELFTSLNTNTKSQDTKMDPSTKATTRKPVLSIDAGTVAESVHTSASRAPINSTRTSISSTDHKCHAHSIVTTSSAHPKQDQPEYTEDHPVVLEFTKAYLEEAFDVKSTKDLLVKQKDQDRTDKSSSLPASPIETHKWWKRMKPEPKILTSGQFDENFRTTSLVTALSDLSNLEQESLLAGTKTNASTQTFVSSECKLDTVTLSAETDGCNLVSPTFGRQMQILRKDVGSGSSKLPHAESNLPNAGESPNTGKDGSSKDKGKNKETKFGEKDPLPTNLEKGSRMEQGIASKGKAKKKKSKRSKRKDTQSKTTAESSQLSQDNATSSKNNEGKPDDSATDKAKLEREHFVAFKVDELREETNTQIVWYNKGDAPCAHPNHPRVWNSKNLWCGGIHQKPCARCKAPCCAVEGFSAQLKNEVLTASEKQSAQNMVDRIGIWVSAGNEESTFLSCTECFKAFCPDCLSLCPLCGDRMCHDCNSVEPWTACELHGEY